MAVLERQLEEDEAKLDNILHKILVSSEKIKIVANEIGEDKQQNNTAREKFGLLSETIYNLALLADEITQHDMKITEELEGKVRNELNQAITNIKEIQQLFE